MDREIDVTITVQYTYSPPEPDTGFPGNISFSEEGVIMDVLDRIKEDIERELEDDRY
jgi:hypothetical protein